MNIFEQISRQEELEDMQKTCKHTAQHLTNSEGITICYKCGKVLK